MESLLFYVFTAIMLGSAIGVIVNRNPISSALCLVLSFVGVAGLFILLSAFFIGIIQILVYAGAVMVLFLFIIMLLDVNVEEKRKVNLGAVGGGIFIALIFLGQLLSVVGDIPGASEPLADIDHQQALVARTEARGTDAIDGDRIAEELAEGSLPDVQLIGEAIFTKYNFHLQMVGVLLLTSTVGVVLLSKKKLS
ncbi:NADH-quinone oxidoreductase subunit J family protein [Sulfuriroseicoccus oceanibius]|uniref:NADH-quinone oxidoreductase subunit J n=1 Tax=Sulfuriroseicoccus oceanibius TaxID=2707525 RepID=A0A6B3L2W8_9BACT|nr:NADH-quinone oxidoreductase subunit J [Sulfuriroseicoccus oceanibius]QQL44269.1 NADH-quinone oxidoreductase subunit J [Sulfuriroseicoccus oceanibius]